MPSIIKSFIYLFFFLNIAGLAAKPLANPSSDSQGKTYTIIEHNKKKGLIDEQGNTIIPTQYDDLGWTTGKNTVFNSIIGYKENHLWGLIDLKNKKITLPLFTTLTPFKDQFLIASVRDKNSLLKKFGLINTQGKTILSFKYFNLEPAGDKLIASSLKNDDIYYGLTNEKGKKIIPVTYGQIRPLSDSRLAITNHENLKAIFDLTGTPLSNFEFDHIDNFQNNYAIVYKNGKQGLINPSGSLVLPAKYKTIRIEEGNKANVANFTQWKLLSPDNKTLNNLHFDQITPIGKNVFKVNIGKKEALISLDGNFLTDFKDWQIFEFSNENALYKENKLYGIINKKGKLLTPANYDTIFSSSDYLMASHKQFNQRKYNIFSAQGDTINLGDYDNVIQGSEGLIPVKEFFRWGFINNKGKKVIPCKFDSVEAFHNQRAKVYYLGGYGIIDTQGNWVINPYKDFLHTGKSNIYIFQDNEYYGLITDNDQEIYKTTNQITPLNAGYLEKNKTGKYGLFNENGKRILDTEFDTISPLLDNKFYVFGKDHAFGIIQKSGKITCPQAKSKIQNIKSVHEDFWAALIDNKWGFVDSNGALRIANQYDAVGDYNQSLAAVKLMGKWGFIDKLERWVIQPNFDEVLDFYNDGAPVRIGNHWGLVNIKGDLIIPVEYDTLIATGKGHYLAHKNNKVGLYEENGHQLIYPKYDKISDLGNGYVLVKRNNKFGVMTINGINTIPIIYDNLTFDPFNNIFMTFSYQDWESITLPR
jgi:hypothetical protein